MRNFLEEAKSLDKRENNLFWKSPRKDVLDSIEHAYRNPGAKEPMFANTEIPAEKLPKTMQHPVLRELQVNFLIKFLTSYNEWAATLLKLESSDFEADERMIVPSKDDKLMHSEVSRKFLSLLENNFSDQEALNLLNLNPKYGIESVRRAVLSFETSEVADAHAARKQFEETETLKPLSAGLERISSFGKRKMSPCASSSASFALRRNKTEKYCAKLFGPKPGNPTIYSSLTKVQTQIISSFLTLRLFRTMAANRLKRS